MIVQIGIFRNELFLLKHILPIWKRYADGFVFLDDKSTDGTYEYLLENKEKYNILDVLRVNPSDDFDELKIETDIRQSVFNKALSYSNKIICLDADEYLDGDFSKEQLNALLDNNPDTVFHLRWIQYTSKNTIRVDGPWKHNLKDRIGCYNKKIDFNKCQMHSTHLPIPINQRAINGNELFASHLQWLDKCFVGIKQYYWKVTDSVNSKKFNCSVAGTEAYNQSVNNFIWEEEYFDYPLRIKSDIFEDVSKFDNYRLDYVLENSKKYNLPNLGDWNLNISDSIPMYFCVAADEKHFPLLINLIGSIHHHNYYDLVAIDVYDLGLTENQKNELKNIKKVNLCEVEKTNPQILDILNTPRPVRGLFSWKPVIIKQSLEKYPYVLYADAGTTILKPLNKIFKHIKDSGYFITSCGHSIKWMTPKHVCDTMSLKDENEWILKDETDGIDAGCMGINKSLFSSFVEPIYKLASNIKNFEDDGSCPNGLGCGRHDQTLFSIQARKLNFSLLKENTEPFQLTHDPKKVTNDTIIFRSRWNLDASRFNTFSSSIKRHLKVSVITAIGDLKTYEKFIDRYFYNIHEQVFFDETEHIIVYSEWSKLFDKYTNTNNIKFIKENEKLGVYNAWNIGIINSTSNNVTNWNVDDIRHPIANKIKYDLLEKNDSISIAYNYYVASKTNETFDNIDTSSKSVLIFPDDFQNYCMSDCLVGPDPMWKKSLHIFCGLFNFKDYSVIGDWEMWIRFSLKGYKFKLIPEVLCIYGDHGDTVSATQGIKSNNQKQLLYSTYKNVPLNRCQIVFKSFNDI
jgi:hypothetical protein